MAWMNRDTDLEMQPWLMQTGPNINPVPADAFIASLLPSGALKVTNVSSKPLGGALVTCKRPVAPAPASGPLPYMGLDMMVLISSYDLPNLARWELDLKVCLLPAPNANMLIPNVANFSSQLNFSTGQWQIDGNPPGWLNTGFKPIIEPDVWFPISFRYFIDFPNSKFSFLSTTWGTQEFTVPSTMQGVPFQVTNWQPVSALQIQMEVLNPGSVSTLYQDLAVSYSDQAF